MRMAQKETIFTPINIVIETREEAVALMDILNFTDCAGEPLSTAARALSIEMSNWFSCEAQL